MSVLLISLMSTFILCVSINTFCSFFHFLFIIYFFFFFFILLRFIFFFFFFSSRRRHTRSLCDWSSDVCSSDLLHSVRGLRFHRGSVTAPGSHQWVPSRT